MLDKATEEKLEKYFALAARSFAVDGATEEVTVLSYGNVVAKQFAEEYQPPGAPDSTYVRFQISEQLFLRLGNRVSTVEKSIFNKILLVSRGDHFCIGGVTVTCEPREDPQWRDKAKVWLSGEGLSNQGRVRSDNIAHRTKDGLLFRSQPEINLYTALKSLGVSFAPLPVFVRGGATYRRIEPDFIVIKDGIMMAIEVDGDTVHHETPAEAHDRTTMLAHEGVKIERVNASKCDTPEKAAKCAQELLAILERYRTSS